MQFEATEAGLDLGFDRSAMVAITLDYSLSLVIREVTQ
jgi:hypothetical protein